MPDLADEGQPQRAPPAKGELGTATAEGEKGAPSISSGDMNSACSHTPSSWIPVREGAFLAGGEGFARCDDDEMAIGELLGVGRSVSAALSVGESLRPGSVMGLDEVELVRLVGDGPGPPPPPVPVKLARLA